MHLINGWKNNNSHSLHLVHGIYSLGRECEKRLVFFFSHSLYYHFGANFEVYTK